MDLEELAEKGQKPFAAVLTCMDSRINIEQIFDLNAGEAFICKVAGNICNDDMLGSLEFSAAVMKVNLIVVMGHTKCGAIMGAVDNVKIGHLTKTLAKIQPAIEACQDYEGEKNSSNQEYMYLVELVSLRDIVESVSLTIAPSPFC